MFYEKLQKEIKMYSISYSYFPSLNTATRELFVWVFLGWFHFKCSFSLGNCRKKHSDVARSTLELTKRRVCSDFTCVFFKGSWSNKSHGSTPFRYNDKTFENVADTGPHIFSSTYKLSWNHLVHTDRLQEIISRFVKLDVERKMEFKLGWMNLLMKAKNVWWLKLSWQIILNLKKMPIGLN